MDLTHISGSTLTASDNLLAIEHQITQRMTEEGFIPPPVIHRDGILHRFSPEGKPNDDAGWYVIFEDSTVPVGIFGSWKTGKKHTFKANIGRTLSRSETKTTNAKMEEAKKRYDEARRLRAEAAANNVAEIWAGCEEAPADHPYLTRKGVAPHGIHITKNGRLVIPMFNDEKIMVTLQYISSEGEKRFQKDGVAGGAGWMIGNMDKATKIYLAEGFATAASIHEETGRPVGIAFSAGNLPKIAQAIRAKAPEVNIVIVADNDASGIGLEFAKKAAKLAGCSVIMPPLVGTDANDYKMAGGNLKELLGECKKRMVNANSLSDIPSPIPWLVKGWVQDKAMVMVHGPSGSGKSFVVLDWMCTIASGLGHWFGKTTQSGGVIYLCGEGFYGLSGRLKAWKLSHNVESFRDFVIAKSPSDLDNPGEFNQVVQDIVDTGISPKLIVIDTLNRFMSGDENSAQDSRKFLSACSHLMERFACTVLIVHHTGLNQDAQTRARGSSAWKGAMDIEISIRPTDNGLTLTMVKSKDTEESAALSLELKSVELPGWFDEDGEQVNSAVLVLGKEIAKAKDFKLARKISEVRRAWQECGGEFRNGKPYIEKSKWNAYLTEKENKKPANARKILSNDSKYLVGIMILNNIIQPFETGFLIINSDLIDELSAKPSIKTQIKPVL